MHTLQTLDKLSKEFIWGSTSEKKKQHLLSWDRICRPKFEGGLGIRKAFDMNTTLIAEIGWRLLSDTGSLWARVVRCKYKLKVFRTQLRML